MKKVCPSGMNVRRDEQNNCVLAAKLPVLVDILMKKKDSGLGSIEAASKKLGNQMNNSLLAYDALRWKDFKNIGEEEKEAIGPILLSAESKNRKFVEYMLRHGMDFLDTGFLLTLKSKIKYAVLVVINNSEYRLSIKGEMAILKRKGWGNWELLLPDRYEDIDVRKLETLESIVKIPSAWQCKPLKDPIFSPNFSYSDFSNGKSSLEDGFCIQDALWSNVPFEYIWLLLPSGAQDEERNGIKMKFGYADYMKVDRDIYRRILMNVLLKFGITVNYGQIQGLKFEDIRPTPDRFRKDVLKSMVLFMDKRLVSLVASFLFGDKAEGILIGFRIDADRFKNPSNFILPSKRPFSTLLKTIQRVSVNFNSVNVSKILYSPKCTYEKEEEFETMERLKMALLTEVVCPLMELPSVYYHADVHLEELAGCFLNEFENPVSVVVITLETFNSDMQRVLLVFHKHGSTEWVEYYDPLCSDMALLKTQNALKTIKNVNNMKFKQMVRRYAPKKGMCYSRLLSYVIVSSQNENINDIDTVSAFVNNTSFRPDEVEKNIYQVAYEWVRAYQKNLKEIVNMEYADLIKSLEKVVVECD